MGKGKSTSEAAQDHQAAPLSTLKDPSSFGPPPKRIHYPGASPSPAHGESGTPLSQPEGSARQRLEARRQAQAEEEHNRPPPGPYRADTTGLDTSHLPKPPIPRAAQRPPAPPTAPSKPRLPPRLPPRQNEYPNEYTQAPPPPYSESPHEDASPPGLLNQGALDRLGRAGVSVPGLDISRSNPSPTLPPRHSPSPSTPRSPFPPPGGNGTSHLGELQSRFSRMSTQDTESPNSSKGTSWADKQAAVNTANTLRNDPSKASISDIKAAASTANDYRDRHGKQAATGWRAANNFGQQQGVVPAASPNPAASAPSQSPTQLVQGGFKKKPPPPPPKRKPPPSSPSPSSPSEPPPIPLGSKPRF